MSTVKRTAGNSPVPPEEEFWQRYSPHYEFPLSTVSSIAIHGLIVALLAVVGWLVAKWAMAKQSPLPEMAVAMVGGGGGNPKGVGEGPGGEPSPPPAEAVENPDKPPTESVPLDTKRESLKPNAPPLQVYPEVKDDSLRKLIDSGNQAVQAATHLSKETQDKLRRGITGKGEGGAGAGGGKDRGTDTGKGSGTGAGTMDQRLKRTLRWVMIFDTFNGDDYARQLAGLGAILAIPQGNNEYMVIHDLNRRPAKGRVEDVEQIKRIFWVDEKRESIAPLCRALGIQPVPDHIVAFFPESLERKLLQLELRYKDRTEDQIYETRFKVRKTAGGYEPVVIDQKAN